MNHSRIFMNVHEQTMKVHDFMNKFSPGITREARVENLYCATNLYYAWQSVTTMWKHISCVIQKYTKFTNFTLLYFLHFTTKLDNFTKLRRLFPTVLKFFSNLKVCLIGKWSIFNLGSLERGSTYNICKHRPNLASFDLFLN